MTTPDTWAKRIRHRAKDGSAVTLSYPDACFIASILEAIPKEEIKVAAKPAKPKKYRVWVEQVNQVSVVVTAKDEEEAKAKGYRKWKREEAYSYANYVEEEKD